MKKEINANARGISFIEASALGNYNERGYKRATEALGAVVDAGTLTYSVYGALGNGFWDSWVSYTDIAAALERASKSDEVERVVLFIDSPGGSVAGLRDLCDYISAVDETKPVYAFITGMACSAAYAIATSARKVYSIKDGQTGCCGCYADPWDYSDEALREMGWIHRIFRSANAPKKNVSPITDEASAKEFQARIDAYGESYLQLCADNRGVSYDTAAETFGQGAVVTAEYAVENKMIDGILSLEEFFDSIHATADPTPITTPTLPDDDEGEGEEDMDITGMSAEAIVAALSAEQMQGVFDAICAANPSLIEERETAARNAENARLEGLNALRNGSEAVDAVVDAAVADGRDANAVALEVISAMRASAPVQNEGASALEKLLDATQDLNVPASAAADGGNPYFVAAEKLNAHKEE